MDKLYSTAKLSELFNKTRQTIVNWIEEGRFPNAQKVGRGYAIPSSDVEIVREEVIKELQNEIERLKSFSEE